MRAAAKRTFFGVTLLLSAALSYAQSVPKTDVTTLTGQSVTFPRIGSDKPLLLLLSFSHKGGDDMESWNKHFKVAYATDQRVEFYELADFQGVPSLIMKMILHGIRRSVPEPQKSHFAPFYADEDNWKKLVGFDNPNIVYVVLASAKGDVLWRTRGPASDATAAELESAVLKAYPASQ
ncbi:MAG: hypothetical protein ACLQVL_07645 [Terriglobia bacterium]